MGCTLAAGGSYQWLFNSLAKLDKDLSFDKLNSLAGEINPGSKGLIFLPYLIGERTPHSDPNARGVFFGLSYEHDIRHMIRSVIEGVAFSQRESVEILKSFSLTAQKLTLSGGAARSPLWCQIMADVLDRNIHQIDNPLQVNTRGAGLLASMALGHLNLADIGNKVSITKTFVPNGANRPIYDDLYREFLNIYKAHSRMHARLNKK